MLNLFLVSLLTRLVFLFFGHQGLTHDETDFYTQGYLLAKTGSDFYGNALFSSSGILTVISPIPVYISAFFFTFLPKTVLTGRLPFAIFNSLIPVFIFHIVKRLTKNQKLSLIVFTVVNFSPWLSYLSSQAGYDSPLSFAFYLGGVSSLLSNFKPKIKQAVFYLMAFLSFNSYMGIKVTFFFLIAAALIAVRIYETKPISLKFIVRSLTVSFLVTALMILITSLFPGGNLIKDRAFNEIVFFDRSGLTHVVWYERHVIKSWPMIEKMVSNKATVVFDLFFDRYLKAFDIRTIFFRGDPHPLYGTYYIGLFYLFELGLLLIGVFTAKKILKNKTNILIPFLIMLFAAPIPVGISTIPDVTIVFRAYPLILPMALFISLGAFYLISLKKMFGLIWVFLLYLISFSFFFLIFQTKIKYMASEKWHLSDKSLSEKMAFTAKTKKAVTLFTDEPQAKMLLYNYYENSDANLIKESLRPLNSKRYRIANLTIEEGCPPKDLLNEHFYIIKRGVCNFATENYTGNHELVPYIEANDGSGTLYWQVKKPNKNI